jgi:hypothetical protein
VGSDFCGRQKGGDNFGDILRVRKDVLKVFGMSMKLSHKFTMCGHKFLSKTFMGNKAKITYAF